MARNSKDELTLEKEEATAPAESEAAAQAEGADLRQAESDQAPQADAATQTLPQEAPAAQGGKAPVRVACVGDSITQGFGSSNIATRSYPALLQQYLGDGYLVRNFGVGGCTLMRDSDQPYWNVPAYGESLAFQPDIVLLMLGTNDTRDANFCKLFAFADDMTDMIQSYQALPSKPTVYVCTAPRIFNEAGERVPDIVACQRVAAERCGCPIVDINAVTQNMDSQFPDRLHPNDSGYTELAQVFFTHVFGGKLHTVSILTQPEAQVTLDAQTKPADSVGLAVFRAQPGEHKLRILLSGFTSVHAAVETQDDAFFDFPLQPGPQDIAKGCAALASSEEAGLPASNAVDGDPATRWASDNSDPQWLQVDLGRAQTITGVRIHWELAYAQSYSIELSLDGESWTEAYSTEEGQGELEEILFDAPETARYVRLFGRQRGTIFGYSLYRLEVLGAAPVARAGRTRVAIKKTLSTRRGRGVLIAAAGAAAAATAGIVFAVLRKKKKK